MVLWNVLGQAATIAQLAGVDAGGLVSMIIQAVQTVHRNREECRQLMHHVMMIGGLLQILQQSEMMQRPEIRRPLDGLEDTLRQAYVLVTSCQQSNSVYHFLVAGNQAQKFRDIRDRIDSYLRIYPLISHIDTRYFLSGLYNQAHLSGAQAEASEAVLASVPSHVDPNYRIEGRTSDDNYTEPVEVQAEPFAVEEQQQAGYVNGAVLSNRRHRFRWLVKWFQRVSVNNSIPFRLIGHQGTGGLTVFKFSELAASTNNFSSCNIIGSGGFGNVYKGVLPNQVAVAIKISHREHIYNRSDFENEVQIIPKLQHANVIKLLGCCFEGDNRILVYEYMPNGSLHYRIDELRAGVTLDWPIRFQIIEGIAHGAAYLHQHSRLRVIHGDLKPGNIVLDCDMTPRITDFGLAKVLRSHEDEEEMDLIAGTMGYIDPEYVHAQTISTMSDVYTYGVLLLEIITAERPIIDRQRQYLTTYAWELWSLGRANDLVDPSMVDEPRISHILGCIQIALLCVQENRAHRPRMSDVVKMLSSCEPTALPVPRPPGTIASTRVDDGSADASSTAGYTSADSTSDEEYMSCCSSDAENEDSSFIA